MGLVPRFDRARNPHVGFVTLRPWLSDMSQLGRLPVDSLRALAVARVSVSDRSAPDFAADVTRSAHALLARRSRRHLDIVNVQQNPSNITVLARVPPNRARHRPY